MADGPINDTPLSPSALRARRAEAPKTRARDFAAAQGITEADLVAAHVGHGATVIDATPDRLFPLIKDLGDVLALTRNESCVHERRGQYSDYRGGPHASMVLDPEIDMRIFPAHWVHGFALAETGADGTVKRSLQVFDAAGDAIHKVHLKPESDVAAFDRLVEALRLDAQPQALALEPRKPVEPAREDHTRAQALRADWDRMTDTHQFLKLVKTHKMNRLGANRVAGAPYAQRLDPKAVNAALVQAAEDRVPVMIFVGNQGCIQIHGGLIDKVVPMGPWINVMDPRFNLHLRGDHIAEVWLVNKPTRTGAAISVEAFDAEGGLILQIFGYRKDTAPDAWNALTLTLPKSEA
ncbi:hemin-degrading factor [Neotabrizicola sp. sgz301269]|uniref:hemin-degrading factor n=1 Tax=Neotabrizicola sp. sgz301269 TaxID=3276282 RepID=UPI00376FB0AE